MQRGLGIEQFNQLDLALALSLAIADEFFVFVELFDMLHKPLRVEAAHVDGHIDILLEFN